MTDACALPLDHLLLELHSHEEELRAWLDSSESNALLFAKDPVAALRAANLGLSEERILELEAVLRDIAQKLGSAPGDVPRSTRSA